ncbi:MAG: ABC transporter permease [Thermomicrobiales bacterium]|nr:ABC transporter permease [Thermomicrobiales bacterium]
MTAAQQPITDGSEGTLLPIRKRTSTFRLLIRSRSAQIGLAIVLILAVLGLLAPVIAPYGPNTMTYTAILVAPSSEHLFGTDDFGRDIFSRSLYGIRISLLVGITVMLISGLIGLGIGLVAGFYSRLDSPIMRAMDVLMAFPGILLAIGIMAVLGPSLLNIIVALAISYIPRTARVVRGQVLSLREQEFVMAARALGASDWQLLLRYLAPNTMAPLLIQQTFVLALAVIAESGLNFLGVGVPPDVPTLGSMLSESRTFLRSAPWVSIFPGLMISMMVLAFNLLGDGLRDVLDPRSRDK